jgi:transcriptional regulator with XRE-family HTH domain
MPSLAELGIQAKALKAARIRRGWSQSRLAAALEQAARSLDQVKDLPPGGRQTLVQYISYFENGRRPVPGRLKPILCEAFQADEQELGLTGQAGIEGQPELPSLSSRHIRSSGLAIVSSLEHALDANVQADAQIGPAYLLPGVQAEIPVIDAICRQTKGTDHKEALRFGSKFMEFCGWLLQDSGDYQCAMQLTDHSLEYGMELDDPLLISYILMRKSNIATDSGRPGYGLGLANTALKRSAGLTPRLRAVALRQRANAHAMLQDDLHFARDIESALIQATLGEAQEETDLAPYCTPSYVEMEIGASWLKLNAPEPAIEIFESSRSRWSATEQARDQALCLARLATAYAEAGAADLACATAGELVSVAGGLRSARVSTQVGGLRASLQPWSKRGDVADLVDRLQAFNLN